MKKILLFLIFLNLSFGVKSVPAFAQATSPTPSDNKIEPIGNTTTSYDLLMPPSNPSLFLLGKNITSIDRPQNPSDLKAALTNGFSNYQSGQDFALEVAPFWIFDRAHITSDNFIDDDIKDNLLQTFTLSMAEGVDPSGNSIPAISTACHFSIMRGTVDKKTQSALDKIKLLLNKHAAIFHDSIKDFRIAFNDLQNFSIKQSYQDSDLAQIKSNSSALQKTFDQMKSDPDTNTALQKIQNFNDYESQLSQLINALNTGNEAEINEYIAEIQKDSSDDLKDNIATAYIGYIRKTNSDFDSDSKAVSESLGDVKYLREGFKFDVYGGCLLDVPSGKPVSIANSAAWGTLGWDPFLGSNWSLLGLGRYLQGNNTELGAQLTWNASDIWGLSGEFTGGLNSGSSYKYDLVVSYKPDKTQNLSFVFGSDNTNYSNNLLALVSLTMGFGNNLGL